MLRISTWTLLSKLLGINHSIADVEFDKRANNLFISMSRVDAWLQRLPGSIAAKSFGVALIVCAALAYPVYKSTETRQGHDYLSSEKPEAVAAGQEKLRREQRHKLKEKQQQDEPSS